MKAVVFEKFGGPEVLQVVELPVPQPGAEEVLVRVHACALNHLDLWVRQGLPAAIPMPHIGGGEVAGVVAALGPHVSDWHVGDRVLVSPGQSCMRCDWCNQGLDSLCDQFRIFGYQTQGGFAEYAVARSRDLIRISEAWSFVEWAAIPLTFVTAWNMLHRRAGVRPGDTVVVFGASSGVGCAGIQVARHAGARVIAVAGSEEKRRKALDLGAHEAIVYTTQDVPQEVKRLTHGKGADIVFEHIGQAVWSSALRCLGKNGRLVTCGATTGARVEIDLRFFFTQQLCVTGAYMGSRSDLHRIVELVERRELRPVVDAVFPLEQTRQAQERMQRREMFGKIVVTP